MRKCSLLKRILCKISNKDCSKYGAIENNNKVAQEEKISEDLTAKTIEAFNNNSEAKNTIKNILNKVEETPKYIKNSKGRWIDAKTGKYVKKEVAENGF